MRILNIEAVRDESSQALLAIIDAVQATFRALRVMNFLVDQWDTLAVAIIVVKLLSSMKRENGSISY